VTVGPARPRAALAAPGSCRSLWPEPSKALLRGKAARLPARRARPQRRHRAGLSMNIYFGIGFTLVCAIYFGVYYFLLLFGNGENNFGMYALASFFGMFLFLGLGGIECLMSIGRKQEA
jgi:ABC-type multidrug transport system permease subunit